MIKIAIGKKIDGRYGNFELKVNTAFNLNAITRIAGPSGIGKTTLLKIIAGLVLPDSGTVSVENVLWFDQISGFSKKVQDRQIGFVFQDYALFPNMTVEKHLKFGTDDESFITHLLELGEMTQLKNRLPKQLSGGQQQRLAILRALSTKPKLLLMDEPFAALDQELKSRLITKLSHFFDEQQTTVILVTHQDDQFIDYNSYSFELKGIGD
ncbi:molybdenum ABC transporter ATP-binding protein [Pedobacter sp. Leaf216]|uniref:sulfate/molybdate ABC transporter ATP-binding protein n=1 Tax=Pedobacter sp. Leaf216 TaxID=1735684 RepID=UPI0006F558FB|nr:ATP-binding cassette domain-containing protein [Pedobacter sp. Leaf216]KQM72639.1 molybdenum ABC transporter ATP-binding protein [Pedobacter sp. Leaf216]